ncbi:hypothetical protein EVAR_79943_1 [Eumeta japonica]|uniref:Uncharacterized protein n=1 Tax=Eumeta variegata TaxID=151549 RepID=A0A4C1Y2G9_EUMVA|nr:hypothetical protein EVAR_79943_1 [Eumeta japonica]
MCEGGDVGDHVNKFSDIVDRFSAMDIEIERRAEFEFATCLGTLRGRLARRSRVQSDGALIGRDESDDKSDDFDSFTECGWTAHASADGGRVG